MKHVANGLTVTRFFLVPVYLLVFFSYSKSFAFVIVVLAGLTDVLDGYIARKSRTTSQLGELLDPLADKAMIVAVLVSFIVDRHVHWLLGTLICLREIGMVSVGIAFYRNGIRSMPSNLLGKMTTIFYYCLFALIVFGMIEFQWLSAQVVNTMLLLLLALSLAVSVRYARLRYSQKKAPPL